MDSNDKDGAYFTSYGKLDVHEAMLRDEARTGAYAEFIAKNEDMFRDRVVLDVGSGTGILTRLLIATGAL